MYLQSHLGIKSGMELATGNFTVRKATMDDATGILACVAAAFAPYRAQYTPDAFTDTGMTPDSVQQRLREMCLFIAVAGGATVGTIGCQVKEDEGHLRGVAVLPDWQGAGVAPALLQAAEHEFQSRH